MKLAFKNASFRKNSACVIQKFEFKIEKVHYSQISIYLLNIS